MAALRGDWEGALAQAEKYKTKIVESKEFWKKQGSEYSTRLFGAELQEAELRDVMANCLYKAGRHDEAETELGHLIEVQPARASAYLNRGMMRYRRAAWDLARADLRRFLALTDLPQDDAVSMEAMKALVVAEERVAEDEDRP
jgi:tetratricopeptide (TPR) repeat protein